MKNKAAELKNKVCEKLGLPHKSAEPIGFQKHETGLRFKGLD